MGGRFLTSLDIHEAKRSEEIWNSMVNRGEIDADTYVRTAHVVCGCGIIGCGWITAWRKTNPNITDLKQQQVAYEKWLKDNHTRHCAPLV